MMAPVRILVFTQEQQQQVEQVRDHHPKASLRERAARLKVSSGLSVRWVARHG